MLDGARYAILLRDVQRAAPCVHVALHRHPLLDATLVEDDADGVFARVGRSGPAMLVTLDARGDGRAAEACARALRRTWPATVVLALVDPCGAPDASDPSNAAQASRWRAAGVAGLLAPGDPIGTVVRTVSRALAGVPWVSPARDAGRSDDGRAVTGAALGLTVRQAQVLWFVLHGVPNKGIARRLGLSEATVKEHVSAILQRLSAGSRIEAIALLRGRELLVPELTGDGGTDADG